MRELHVPLTKTDFSTSRNKLLTEGHIPIGPQYTLAGLHCWSFLGVPDGKKNDIFTGLVSRATHGMMATFLPAEGIGDGIIRVMVPYDRSLLETLFGRPAQETDIGM